MRISPLKILRCFYYLNALLLLRKRSIAIRIGTFLNASIVLPDIENARILSKNRPLLHKAQENYLCYKTAIRRGWANAAVSRLYYSLFLAGKHYLVEKDKIKPQDKVKHGEISLLIGKVSGDYGYGTIFNYYYKHRRWADYNRIVIKKLQVEEHEDEAISFLDFVLRETMP